MSADVPVPRPIGSRLVIASHNPGKLQELEELLAPLGIEAVLAATLGLPEPEETGDSFAANARLKAVAAAGASGLPALADDSGLVVPTLGGAPGIYSARWAGPQKDFDAAMRRLQQSLGEARDRNAYFVCVLALAWPDGATETYEGRCDGSLVWPPRGEGGFGYDPMFRPDGHDRTFGEMTATAKQALSHRARAFARLLERLRPEN